MNTKSLAVISLSGIFSAFCLILPTMQVLSPRAVVPLIVISALATCAVMWVNERRLPVPDRTFSALFAGLVAWILVASMWSFDVIEALIVAVRLAALVLACLMLVEIARGMDRTEAKRATRWLLIGVALALLVVIFERTLGQPLHLLGSEVSRKHSLLSEMNRGATGLAILVWPVTAVLYRSKIGSWALAVPVLVFAILASLESMAALVALAAALVFALVAFEKPINGRKLLVFAVLAMIVAMPFLANGIAATGLADAAWLDLAGRHRVQIWGFVADRIAEKPGFGWGFHASPDIPNLGIEPFYEAHSKVIPTHPHNAGIQVWLELGAIGAAIMMAILLVLAWRIDGLSEVDRIFAQAAFLSALIIASLSYGIWQNQWVATLFAAVVVIVLCRDEPRDHANSE